MDQNFSSQLNPKFCLSSFDDNSFRFFEFILSKSSSLNKTEFFENKFILKFDIKFSILSKFSIDKLEPILLK